MKDENTMCPYFPEWMPMGDNNTTCETLTEKGNYYG